MNLSTIIAQTRAQLDALTALQAATETLEAMGLQVQIVAASGPKPDQEVTTPEPQQNNEKTPQRAGGVTTASKPDQKRIPKNGRSKHIPSARWTEYEDGRAVEMAAKGRTAAQIATYLGRPVHGTAWRLKNKLAERIRAAQAIDEGIGVDPIPAPKPEVAPDPPAPCDGFTAQMDADLVEMICQGWKITEAAQWLVVSEADARSRWNALKPNPLTFEAQTKLLAQLKAKAAGESA